MTTGKRRELNIINNEKCPFSSVIYLQISIFWSEFILMTLYSMKNWKFLWPQQIVISFSVKLFFHFVFLNCIVEPIGLLNDIYKVLIISEKLIQ